jgi:hypothetical protein
MKKQLIKSLVFVSIDTGPVSNLIVQDWHLLFYYGHLCASLTQPESDYHRGMSSYLQDLG